MLIYDNDSFEIIDHTEDNLVIYKNDIVLKNMKNGRLGEIDPYELKMYKDSLSPEYSLVTKKEMILGSEHEKIRVPKGTTVVMGNRNFFYGVANCYFENSYFPGLVINMANNNSKVEIRDSLFINKTTPDANNLINLNIDDEFLTSNAHVGIKLEKEFKFIDRRYTLKTLPFSVLNIYDSKVTLSQNIVSYDRNTQYNYPDISLDSVGLMENGGGVSPEITYSTVSSISMENVKFTPNVNLFLHNPENVVSNNPCIFSIVNTVFETKNPTQHTRFFLSGKHTGIRDLKIISECEKTNNLLYKDMYLLGFRDETQIKSSLKLTDRLGNGEEDTMSLTVNRLDIDMGENTTLDIRGEGENNSNSFSMRMTLSNNTCNLFNANRLINCKNLYVKNSSLPNMMIDTHILSYSPQSSPELKLIDTEIEDGEIRLEKSIYDETTIKGSKVKRGKIKLIDISSLNIDLEEGYCLLERNDFASDSKLIVRSKNKQCFTKISNSVFLNSSRTEILSSIDFKSYIDNIAFKEQNRLEDVKSLSFSTLTDSELSFIDEMNISTISGCKLSNIVEISSCNLTGSDFVFNTKNKSLLGIIKSNDASASNTKTKIKSEKIKIKEENDIDLF